MGPRNIAVEKPILSKLRKTYPSTEFCHSRLATYLPCHSFPTLVSLNRLICLHSASISGHVSTNSSLIATLPKLSVSVRLGSHFLLSTTSKTTGKQGTSLLALQGPESKMGRIFRRFLDSSRIYTCLGCDAHLADEEHVISKNFQGRLGRAFLFEKAVNFYRGPVENRVLSSGVYKLSDIRCTVCNSLLGWIYLESKEDSQKYKEGRILLERMRLTRKGNWL